MSVPMFPVLQEHDIARRLREARRDGLTTVVVQFPWSLIAPHEQQAQANHYQSLKRLAERGGLSACEAVAVLQDRKWRAMPLAEANDALLAMMQAHAAELAALAPAATVPGEVDHG